MRNFRIALTQQPPVFLNKHESISRALSIIEEAAENGADIIIFPETWLPGYPIWVDTVEDASLWDHKPPKKLFGTLFENSIDVEEEDLSPFLAVSARLGIIIVMGLNERSGKTLYNSIYFIDGERDVILPHRKLIPTYTERLIWGRGDGSTLNILKTPHGNVGGLICWEHFMPLARAAMYAQKELLHIAQWPSVKEIHRIASMNYAFEGSCFVAACGTVITKKDVLAGYDSLDIKETEVRDFLDRIPGSEETLLYDGGSCVIAPDGSFLLEPRVGSKATFYVDIHPGEIHEKSMYLDSDGHYSRPDIFTLTVNTKRQKNVEYGDDN